MVSKSSKAAKTPARKQTDGERLKLADLEAEIAATLKECGAQPVKGEIAKLGDPVVKAGRLVGYTPARYGNGKWISDGVVKRVAALVGPMREPIPAHPAATTTEIERAEARSS